MKATTAPRLRDARVDTFLDAAVRGKGRTALECREELSQHVFERSRELMIGGRSEAEAIRVALEEFGDVAELRRRFDQVRWVKVRRRIMQISAVGVCAAVIGLAAMTFQPGCNSTERSMAKAGVAPSDSEPRTQFSADGERVASTQSAEVPQSATGLTSTDWKSTAPVLVAKKGNTFVVDRITNTPRGTVIQLKEVPQAEADAKLGDGAALPVLPDLPLIGWFVKPKESSALPYEGPPSEAPKGKSGVEPASDQARRIELALSAARKAAERRVELSALSRKLNARSAALQTDAQKYSQLTRELGASEDSYVHARLQLSLQAEALEKQAEALDKAAKELKLQREARASEAGSSKQKPAP